MSVVVIWDHHYSFYLFGILRTLCTAHYILFFVIDNNNIVISAKLYTYFKSSFEQWLFLLGTGSKVEPNNMTKVEDD